MEVKPNFILPENYQYSCQMCGSCCRQWWGIGFSKKEVNALSRINWREIISSRAARAPFVKKKSKGKIKYFARQIKNRCIFLTEGNLCLIHKRLGYQAKGRICKTFPFRFIETPDGVVVGGSFVCPSIISNQGRPLKEQVPLLKSFYSLSSSHIRMGPELLLTDELKIPWQEYTRIENNLVGILSQEKYSLEDRLLAGHLFLRSLVKNLRAPSAYSFPEKVSWESFFEAAKRIDGNPRKQRLFLLFFILSSFPRKDYHKLLMGRGRIRSGLLPRPVNLNNLSRLACDSTDPELNQPLERYLKHLILSKIYLLPSRLMPFSILNAYCHLLAFYALIRWFGLAIASGWGKERVEREDIKEAIRVVDRTYVGHINLDAYYFNKRGVVQVVNLLLSTPRFVGTIVRRERSKNV